MTQQYGDAARCAEFFEAGGFEQVRRVAAQGLAELGPDPVLYRWLGLAHAAERDDDHDAEAERAYTAGLKQWPDDLGLLVSHLELCVGADGWEHPGRARAVEPLKSRIAQLAPPGSPEAEQVEAAVGRFGRGYWADVRTRNDEARATSADRDDFSAAVAEATTRAMTAQTMGEQPPVDPEDLRAAEIAATLEALAGPSHAPLRLLLRHRPAAYVVTCALAFLTNKALVLGGVVSFSLWGWLLFLPLLVMDAKVRNARGVAQRRVIAAIEARHASTPAQT
ncbi:hypothetical protein [Streptomyces sp. NPDC048442]|uniref:hypothetical protein n=1 Tax=Streptomyces sp. NPDC048442 TaxID=3154823 RepID=UPI00343D5052